MSTLSSKSMYTHFAWHVFQAWNACLNSGSVSYGTFGHNTRPSILFFFLSFLGLQYSTLYYIARQVCVIEATDKLRAGHWTVHMWCLFSSSILNSSLVHLSDASNAFGSGKLHQQPHNLSLCVCAAFKTIKVKIVIKRVMVYFIFLHTNWIPQLLTSGRELK